MNFTPSNKMNQHINFNSYTLIKKNPSNFKKIQNNNNLQANNFNLNTSFQNNQFVLNKNKIINIPKAQNFKDLSFNQLNNQINNKFNTTDTQNKNNNDFIQINQNINIINKNNIVNQNINNFIQIHNHSNIINKNIIVNQNNNFIKQNVKMKKIKKEFKTEIIGAEIFGKMKPLGQALTEGNNKNININNNMIGHIDLNKQILLTKKYNINIIYYDEALPTDKESNNICAYFKLKLEGVFYRVNNYNLFLYICHKISQNKRAFILITSGSCAKKLFDYLSQKNINQIYKYYIYCMHKQNYEHLKNFYPKLKEIFTEFNDLAKDIFSNENLIFKNPPIIASNFIYFNDYNKTYIKLHMEIIRKYSLYKLMKLYNNDKSKFIESIKKKKNIYYETMARELVYNDDEAMIKYFKSCTNEPEEELRKIFNNIHNVQSYVSNYTLESFYYKYINKFLRKGDFHSFRIFSNHISKFIYNLLEYRKTKLQNTTITLYRTMRITKEEFTIYLNSIGKVICYPSFTSTSSKNLLYCPFGSDPNLILVKLIIQQNNCKSIISIRDLSEHPSEEEYLCLPFTFFKITNVECKTVNIIHSDIIYLTALNSQKPIEDMFLEFMENETDNLDPEGLDMLRLTNNDTTIFLNPYIHSNFYKKYAFLF